MKDKIFQLLIASGFFWMAMFQVAGIVKNGQETWLVLLPLVMIGLGVSILLWGVK